MADAEHRAEEALAGWGCESKKTGYATRGPAVQSGLLSLPGLWFQVGVTVSILVLSNGAETGATNAPSPSTYLAPSIAPNAQREGNRARVGS